MAFFDIHAYFATTAFFPVAEIEGKYPYDVDGTVQLFSTRPTSENTRPPENPNAKPMVVEVYNAKSPNVSLNPVHNVLNALKAEWIAKKELKGKQEDIEKILDNDPEYKETYNKTYVRYINALTVSKFHNVTKKDGTELTSLADKAEFLRENWMLLEVLNKESTNNELFLQRR